MKTIKIMLIFVLVLGFTIAFSMNSYAISIIQGEVNEVLNLATSSVITISESMPKTLLYDWLKNVYSKYYVSIVRFPVLPGGKYTLYIKYPIDGIGRLYTFTGSNPNKSKGAVISFQGVDKSRIEYYKCNVITHRINITISPKSDSSLYIIYATSTPNISTTFILKHPNEPNTLLEKIAPYPGCNPQIKQYWGSVWKDPLLLVKDPNMVENEKTTAGMKFTGNWVQKDDPNSKLKIKRLGGTYFISLIEGEVTLRGSGLSYGNKLIGTFVSQKDSSAGNLRISLNGEELIFYALSLNCELKWKKVYTRIK